MPIYEYICQRCDHVEAVFTKYELRDAPQTCEQCGADVKRGYHTPPNVRTPKTSVSFVDSHGKGLRQKALMADIKKAAELDEKALDFHPNSTEYKDMKRESKERMQGTGKGKK